jgi:hypothetical protein
MARMHSSHGAMAPASAVHAYLGSGRLPSPPSAPVPRKFPVERAAKFAIAAIRRFCERAGQAFREAFAEEKRR